MMFFDSHIFSLSPESVFDLEKESIKQSASKTWYEARKYGITSRNAHNIFKRKKNFETLAKTKLNPKPEDKLPKFTQEALKHGLFYEPVARKKYHES